MHEFSIDASLRLFPLMLLTLTVSCSTAGEKEPDPAPVCEECSIGDQRSGVQGGQFTIWITID